MKSLCHIARRKAYRATFISALIVPIIAGLALTACSDDDGPYAEAYVQALADVTLSAEGARQQIMLDNGTTYMLTNAGAIALKDAETPCRAVVVYTVEDATHARLYNLLRVFCQSPSQLEEAQIKHDPLTLESIWRSGRYVNLRMSLAGGTDVSHVLAFADEGITTQADGTRCLRLALSHEQTGTPAAYHTTTFASCPLNAYADALTAGTDSVSLTLTTTRGIETHTFAF